jgi:hypothetical protein
VRHDEVEKGGGRMRRWRRKEGGGKRRRQLGWTRRREEAMAARVSIAPKPLVTEPWCGRSEIVEQEPCVRVGAAAVSTVM